jgi:hypothetical protein
MIKPPPNCPQCGNQTRSGIAGGKGDPPLVPLFVCYECNQATVVGAEDASTWWMFWTRGRVEADGKWHDVSELTGPEPAAGG